MTRWAGVDARKELGCQIVKRNKTDENQVGERRGEPARFLPAPRLLRGTLKGVRLGRRRKRQPPKATHRQEEKEKEDSRKISE